LIHGFLKMENKTGLDFCCFFLLILDEGLYKNDEDQKWGGGGEEEEKEINLRGFTLRYNRVV